MQSYTRSALVYDEKIEIDDSYLRSPIGDISELKKVEENSGLIEYRTWHFCWKRLPKYMK